jgi:hypothetical protein
MSDQQRESLKRSLQSELDQTIEVRIDRCLSINHLAIVGHHHFAHASHECLLLYRDGYFTSCIMVTQALAEGIIMFVAERNGIRQAHEEKKQGMAARMEQLGLISKDFVEAFNRIQGAL